MARSKRRDPCKVCGTRIFRPNDEAVYVCRNGHVLEGSRIEENEVEFGAISSSHKRKKVNRITKPKTPYIFIQNLNRQERKFIFITAYQYLLKLQVQTLISQFGFPSELEATVKKFWSFFVDSNSKLQITWSEFKTLKLPTKLQPAISDVFDSASFLKAPELSGLEVQEDSDSQVSGDLEESLEKQINENDKDLFPFKNRSIRWSLVLIYLGCQYLRYPILAVDILNLANNDELPFRNMYQKLPKKFKKCAGLSLALNSTVCYFACFYKKF